MRKCFVFILIILGFLILHYSFPAIIDAQAPCSRGLTREGVTTTDPTKIKTCQEVNTAIGKIGTEPQAFVERIFSLVLGLAGGIALILIIIAGYKFMVSRGNPEAVKGATEQLTSAVIGLLFIIFAFVILQIVGLDILRIPEFK